MLVGQLPVASPVGLGAAPFGSRRFAIGAGAADRLRLLQQLPIEGLQLRALGFQRRLRRRFAGLGGAQALAEVARVQAQQQVAGLDVGVVGHQHLGDVAGDLRADRHPVGAYIGIVGALQEASAAPPPGQQGGERDGAGEAAQQPGSAPARGCWHGFASGVFDGFPDCLVHCPFSWWEGLGAACQPPPRARNSSTWRSATRISASTRRARSATRLRWLSSSSRASRAPAR